MHYKNKKTKTDKTKLIYGRHPVVDAIKNGIPIEKIMLSTVVKGPFEKELRNLCKEKNIPLHIYQDEKYMMSTKIELK